jgi:hypothetical protein
LLLAAGLQQASEDLLGACAILGLVAAPDLAHDHQRTQGLFRPPVGGVDAGMAQEGQQHPMLLLIPEMIG